MKTILLGLGKKLLKGIPGSGIITEVKDTLSKDKPNTWAELGFYVVGVGALWLGLYYGIIEEGTFLKFIKTIF